MSKQLYEDMMDYAAKLLLMGKISDELYYMISELDETNTEKLKRTIAALVKIKETDHEQDN